MAAPSFSYAPSFTCSGDASSSSAVHPVFGHAGGPAGAEADGGATAFSRSSLTRSMYGKGVVVFTHESSICLMSGRIASSFAKPLPRNRSRSTRYAAGLPTDRQPSHAQKSTDPKSVV